MADDSYGLGDWGKMALALLYPPGYSGLRQFQDSRQQQQALPVVQKLNEYKAKGWSSDPNFTGDEWTKGLLDLDGVKPDMSNPNVLQAVAGFANQAQKEKSFADRLSRLNGGDATRTVTVDNTSPAFDTSEDALLKPISRLLEKPAVSTFKVPTESALAAQKDAADLARFTLDPEVTPHLKFLEAAPGIFMPQSEPDRAPTTNYLAQTSGIPKEAFAGLTVPEMISLAKEGGAMSKERREQQKADTTEAQRTGLAAFQQEIAKVDANAPEYTGGKGAYGEAGKPGTFEPALTKVVREIQGRPQFADNPLVAKYADDYLTGQLKRQENIPWQKGILETLTSGTGDDKATRTDRYDINSFGREIPGSRTSVTSHARPNKVSFPMFLQTGAFDNKGNPILLNRRTGEVAPAKNPGQIDVASGKQDYKATEGTLVANEKRLGALKTFTNRIDKAVPIVENLARKYGNNFGGLVNQMRNNVKRHVGNTGDLKSLELALVAIQGELGKVETGSLGIAGAPVSQIQEMRKILNESVNARDIIATMPTIKALSKTSVDAVKEVSDEIRGRRTTGGRAPKGIPPGARSVTGPGGQKGYLLGGKVYTLDGKEVR